VDLICPKDIWKGFRQCTGDSDNYIYILTYVFKGILLFLFIYTFFLSIDLYIINSIDLYIAKGDDKLFKVGMSRED